jgi:hypothetical protein
MGRHAIPYSPSKKDRAMRARPGVRRLGDAGDHLERGTATGPDDAGLGGAWQRCSRSKGMIGFQTAPCTVAAGMPAMRRRVRRSH